MKSSLLILGAISLLSFIAPAWPQNGQWTPPINVSNTPRYSIEPDMAIGPDGRIHVVWSDNSRLLSYGNYDILYSVYSENTCFWSAPVQLSPMESTYSGDSRIAIDSLEHPHVVWTHRNLYPDAVIYYSTLTDSGWTAPLNLTQGVVGRNPDITIDHRGHIHVIWGQVINGVCDVYHRYCKNNQWSYPINATNSIIGADCGRIEKGNGNELHLLYQRTGQGSGEPEVFYTKYNGVSWSPGQNVSQSPTIQSIDPDLAVDPQGHPHAVWTEYYGTNLGEIFYSCFNGSNWSTPQNISNLGMSSDYASISVNCQNNVCILFTTQMQSGQPPHVFYTFRQSSHWTNPDTVISNYISCLSAITANENGIFHACLEIVPPSFEDIGYTKFEVNDSRLNNVGKLPNKYSALNIFPNPFNQSTKITYSLITSLNTPLFIYGIYGDLIKTVYSASSGVSPLEFIWDGTNQNGNKISSGIYIVKLKTENQVIINKIYLIK